MTVEKKFTVAPEQAELEFDNFCEGFCLDVDTGTMDQESREAFIKNKNRIVNAIRRGKLVFNDNGEPVYTPWRHGSSYKEAITFRERTGATILATDQVKKGRDAAKTYAMLGDLTGLAPAIFTKLAGEDIKVCEALMVLLMD